MNCPRCSGYGWLKRTQTYNGWNGRAVVGWGPCAFVQYDTVVPLTFPEVLPRKGNSKPCLECGGTGQAKEAVCV